MLSLSSPISEIDAKIANRRMGGRGKGVRPTASEALEQGLEIVQVRQLLHHYPRRYIDRSAVVAIGDLNGDGVVNVVDALIALQMAAGSYPAGQVTPTMLFNVHVAPLSITGRPAGGSATYNPPTVNTVSIADALLILQRAVGIIFW